MSACPSSLFVLINVRPGGPPNLRVDNLLPTDTVLDLKRRILQVLPPQQQHGTTQPESVKLIFAGSARTNDQTLSDCHIQSGDSLVALVQA